MAVPTQGAEEVLREVGRRASDSDEDTRTAVLWALVALEA